MAKRTRSSSTATASDAGNAAHDAPRPAKRRACSIPARSPPKVDSPPLGCTLPLTLQNLSQHTRDSSLTSSPPPPPSMSSRSGSPTRSAWDNRATLRSYNIEVDAARALPHELQEHVDHVLLRARTQPPSPNARRIVQTRLAASLENESTGIRKVEPLLLFAGEDDPTALNAVPRLSSKLNFNLSRDFLPPVPPGKDLVRLSQPQPDTAIGYLSNHQALSVDPQLATAFSVEEEEALGSFTLNSSLMFPFLTSQWKPATGESHMIAHAQSARDGATIVRYLDEFYQTAYTRHSTLLESSHISLTCDIQAVNIWIHWREVDAMGATRYYMKSIYDCTLRNEKYLVEARAILWNHIDNALDARLQSLKAALKSFRDRYPKIKATMAKSRASSKASASVASSIAYVSLPPTPSSNDTEFEPVKGDRKRQKIG